MEDQYHFVFHCSAYNEKRDIFTVLMKNRIPGYNNMIRNLCCYSKKTQEHLVDISKIYFYTERICFTNEFMYILM